MGKADDGEPGGSSRKLAGPAGRKPRVVAILNQKGGSGKTTTAVNLSCGLARGIADGRKRAVLLVDLDPQSASTAALLGVAAAQGPQETPTIRELLLDEARVGQVVQRIELKSAEGASGGVLDLVASHITAAGVELDLFVQEFNREGRLRSALASLGDQYEFVVIDCPPSLNMLTFNALAAATEVLIPVDPGVFPLIGLSHLMDTMEKARRVNPSLRLLGVLPTRQKRTVLTRGTEEKLKARFGEQVFSGIPERVAINEAHTAQTDVYGYEPTGSGARAYKRLVREVIRRGEEGTV
jgi:chromosome partitioning protein